MRNKRANPNALSFRELCAARMIVRPESGSRTRSERERDQVDEDRARRVAWREGDDDRDLLPRTRRDLERRPSVEGRESCCHAVIQNMRMRSIPQFPAQVVSNSCKGPSIYDVRKIFGILNPPFPLCPHFVQPISTVCQQNQPIL